MVVKVNIQYCCVDYTFARAMPVNIRTTQLELH